MATAINSPIGKVHLLKNNPRTIRQSAFERLCESVERDKDFLMLRGIIVWQAPEIIPIAEGEKNPFAGNEGQLVVLGGNQRLKALMAIGEPELKAEWIVEAKDAEGNWISPEAAARLTLLDNGAEGISGTDDYKKMLENFSDVAMRMAGIDFSNFQEELAGNDNLKKAEDNITDELESGEHGEKDPQLKEFIEHREQKRKDISQLCDTGFYICVVFESVDEKIDFVQKMGLAGDAKRTLVDSDVYVCLVFESYDQKMEFAQKAGLLEEPKDGDPGLVFGKFCDGRALAAKFGITLKDSMLHFSDRRLDGKLTDMARDGKKQMTEGEMQERDHARNLKEGKYEEVGEVGEDGGEEE